MSRDPQPIYLTFDDGPDPAGTPRVLEALARHGATATFFVLGQPAREQPELLDEIRTAGHRIELHGDAHLDHRYATAQELIHDTGRAVETLAEHGVTPRWWRLPWGRPGRSTEPLASGLGLRIVGWDVDTHDWRGDGPAEQPDGIGRRLRPGAVVLMHDGFGPGATRDDIANTIELIDHIAGVAAQAGIPLRPLPDPDDRLAALVTDQAGTAVDHLHPDRSLA